jgi:superoxide dismutase, Cu-Zn family
VLLKRKERSYLFNTPVSFEGIAMFNPSIQSRVLLALLLPLVPAALGCSSSSDKGAGSASVSVAALAASGVSGTLTFAASSGGVTITGTISGLPPNTQHGFHVHENGACGDATATDGTVTIGGAAGGHWNPAGQMHGAPTGASHLGDLGNVSADANGVATVSITKTGMTLGDGATTDPIGKAVIVHANPDDLTSQPVGNAGGRIGCGVITKS